MKSTYAPKPFSAWELAVGVAALAAVALIAFVGLRVPRQQVSSPAEPSSLSDAVLPSSPSFTSASGEQLSERGGIRKSPSFSISSAKAGSASSTPLPAGSAVVTSADSAAATSPNFRMAASAGPMPAPSENPTGNASTQIAVQQQPLADQVPTEEAPTQQPTSRDSRTPPPAHWSLLFAAPAGAIPLPRKRPYPITVAEGAIPLPRPRPDAAKSQAPPGPSDWLSGIFQSTPSSTVEPAPVHQGDY